MERSDYYCDTCFLGICNTCSANTSDLCSHQMIPNSYEDFDLTDLSTALSNDSLYDSLKTSFDPLDYIFESTYKVALPNIGNSCFINCILQIFLHDSELYAALIAKFGRDDLLVRLQSLYSTFANINVGEQCDAVLFLNYVLDQIEENLTDKEWAFETWKQKWSNLMTCTHCNHKSKATTQLENMWFLYPTSNQNFVEMEECCKTQKVTFVEDFKCQECGEKGINKLSLIENFPENLFINLQYFQDRQFAAYESILLTVRGHKQGYELQGFIVHRGTQNCGHYIAYMKEGERWFSYSDEKITKCVGEIEDILLENKVPLLWYKQEEDLEESGGEEDIL